MPRVIALTPFLAAVGTVTVPILIIKALWHAASVQYYKKNASIDRMANIKQLKQADKQLSHEINLIKTKRDIGIMARCIPLGLFWATRYYDSSAIRMGEKISPKKDERANLKRRIKELKT